MKWGKEFSVGIQELDQQHSVLADCVTALENAIGAKERWISTHSAIIRTANYARFHFAVEESLMRIHRYPLLETHIAEHQRFSNYQEELQTKSLTATMTQEAIAFIKGWLEQHVRAHDQPYAVHFRAHGG